MLSTETKPETDDFLLEEAADRLKSGGLVAFPTETVYGLGGDATNDSAVARIFEAKGRPRFNPLIVHVPDLAAAEQLAGFGLEARRLAEAHWPGPLTIVLPRRPGSRLSLLVSAGLDTVAIRVPVHPLAQRLLRAAGLPLAAPSANRSGRVSPTTATHVREEFESGAALVLDGGACRVGVESTVIDLSHDTPRLLRPGGVPQEALEAILGPIALAETVEDGVLRASPGMSSSHYAPSRPVRLNATDRRPGEAFVAFGAPPDGTSPDAQLSAGADTTEAAARLFATLRALDRPPFTGIAVMPIPERGLGAAINDRLRRAAAPRG